MIPISLTTLANVLDGELVGSEDTITRVCSDSRQLQTGDFFVALKGPNFDGHRFVKHAAELGCLGALVDTVQDIDIPQIVVKDCQKALGAMGAYVKQQVNPKTVAITGSSGKTTVKEMVASILSRLGNVLATSGNFNNEIGVPLTLLRLEPQHEFAVIELGANHQGEIANTTALTKPDVAIINNIAAAHLEGFGDLRGVAQAKGEIFSGLSETGVAIYNQDAVHSEEWQWRLEDKNVKRFSIKSKSDCFCENVHLDQMGCASFNLITELGSVPITLPVPGKHNVANAVAAASVAIEFGATLEDIHHGLVEMVPVKGRLNLINLPENFTLIDDTYNANVESTKAAVDLLSSYDGLKVLILGDMAELGEDARSYHHEIGEYAKTKNINKLLTLGVLSQSTSSVFEENGRHFSSRDLLVEHLEKLLQEEEQAITVLVKGSRSARMELVVKAIADWRNNNNKEGSAC